MKEHTSILTQDFWPRLRPLVYIQIWRSKYSRQVGGFRFHIKNPPDALINAKMPCLICGNLISPVRVSQGSSGPYYLAICCPQKLSNCSQNELATEEYDLIRFDLQARQFGLIIARDRLRLCSVCGAHLNTHSKPFPKQFPNLVEDCAGRFWKLKL